MEILYGGLSKMKLVFQNPAVSLNDWRREYVFQRDQYLHLASKQRRFRASWPTGDFTGKGRNLGTVFCSASLGSIYMCSEN